MGSDRRSFHPLRGVLVASLLLLSCCSSAAPPAVEDELVRPAEPLQPEAADEARGSAETPPADAPEPPNRIRSLELSTAGAQTVLEVAASRPMVWLSQREDERRLVVELPGTFPGAEVEEIATFEGLVAAVLFEADPSEPRTRIIILTRGPAFTSLVPFGDSLLVKLSPAEPEPVREAAAAEETLAAPPGVQPSPEAALGEEVFELQLGLFSVADNAAGLAADLERRGYPAYVVDVTNSRGRVFHTVRLGPYASRDEALRSAAAYREREGGETLLRRRPRPPVAER
jgi:septal ring-binding cell division protein DamX